MMMHSGLTLCALSTIGSVIFVSNANMSQVAALVAVNTTLSACAGALSAMFLGTLLDLRAYVISLTV
jgi:ammonia channel protein AmtB